MKLLTNVAQGIQNDTFESETVPWYQANYPSWLWLGFLYLVYRWVLG